VLLRRVGSDKLFVMVGKHVPTAVHTRPTKVPQPLGKQQMELIVREVREQITIAVEGLVADLEDRFPRHDALYGFEIISPEYWYCQSVPEDFDNSLEVLIAEFGVSKKTADGNVVRALIDGERLQNEKDQFQSLALILCS
jgi:hypothetical protein